MPTISLEKLAYIIEKAREFDVEVPVEPGAEDGSDPADDDERQVLLDTPDNPSEQELRDAIDGLNLDEREELVALMLIGRGDFDAPGWREALRQVRDSGTAGETDELVRTPLLADYLEAGIDALGLSLDGLDRG
jgi:hypothetical protein